MSHLESLEDRCHFITGVDTSFAGGGLSVKGQKVRQLLPTSAGIFVETVRAKLPYAGATVTKYTTAGRPDAAWGDHGHIAVGPVVDGAVGLAYDARGNLLYVASPTVPGETTGSQINIQRYRSDGTLDTSFGNRGTFLDTPAKVNKRKYVLARMEPLAGGKILIAYTQTDQVGLRDGVSPGSSYLTQDTIDLNLIRLTRAGRADITFGGRGVITVATGTQQRLDNISVSATADTQTLADLRLRADGSARVLTLHDVSRHTVIETVDDEDETVDETQSLTSVVVGANGAFRRALSQHWTLAHHHSEFSGGNTDPLVYVPLSTELDPDGNVTVIGRRGTGGAAVLRLSSTGFRSAPQALPLPAGQTARTVIRGDDGTTFVDTVAAIVKLDASLSPVRGWGTGGVLATPDPVDADLATDAEGRLLVLDADRLHVRRLDGG